MFKKIFFLKRKCYNSFKELGFKSLIWSKSEDREYNWDRYKIYNLEEKVCV